RHAACIVVAAMKESRQKEGAKGRATDAPKQRRSLSMQTRPARVDRHGDPKLAAQLARALDVAVAGEEHAWRYPHGFHTYPARMHPLTARRALATLELGKGAIVLDPFCGSGTVLVEAALVGARAVGVDANPLAVAIARAKTW